MQTHSLYSQRQRQTLSMAMLPCWSVFLRLSATGHRPHHNCIAWGHHWTLSLRKVRLFRFKNSSYIDLFPPLWFIIIFIIIILFLLFCFIMYARHIGTWPVWPLMYTISWWNKIWMHTHRDSMFERPSCPPHCRAAPQLHLVVSVLLPKCRHSLPSWPMK